MVALVQAFLDIVGAFITFVNDYLVPVDAASITILHVAIWTPVIIGLAGLVVGFLKGMWSRRGKRG